MYIFQFYNLEDELSLRLPTLRRPTDMITEMRITCAPGELDLLCHCYVRQLMSKLEILMLPMSQFPGKLGQPSRCEHTMTSWPIANN